MSLGKVDHERGGYSAFLFVPLKLDISFCKIKILIVYGCHIDVAAGIHRKLFSDGGYSRYL